MTWIAIVLVCISAVFHAAWNLISKKNDPSATFFAVSMCFGALITSPLLFIYFDTYFLLSAEAWIGTVLTGIWQTMYFFSLAASYRHGDISIAYPLARSSPLIVVTISGLLLGHSDLISWLCIIGVVVIVVGTFLLPMKSFGDFSLKNYCNKMALFALIAACGTALYSITDDHVLRSIADQELGLSELDITLLYIGIQAASVAFFTSLAVVVRKDTRERYIHLFRHEKRLPFVVAFISYLTYILVLLAYQYADEVSYVVAFRQLSIPLGAVLGVCILKEPASVPKFLAVLIIMCGLIMVAVG